jgi:predicted dithiol-disulfide oxidoreductase (DUF899 family)
MARRSTRTSTARHRVVSHQDWIAARTALLRKEKVFTRLRDRLSQQRRALPWEKVDKEYIFDTPEGKRTLSELFGTKSQLVVYQFMFPPDWKEGCPHCSFWADHYDGMLPHLGQRDVSFVVVSRAPLRKIERFKKRMGWRFRWVSSGDTDYNYDYQGSFRPDEIATGKVFYNYERVPMEVTDREGISVFYKAKAGAMFHTYSTYARGIDMVNGTYQFLDLAPKGRDEGSDFPQEWVRHHDRYPREKRRGRRH